MKQTNEKGNHTFLDTATIVMITLVLALTLDAAANLYRCGNLHDISGVYGGYYAWQKQREEELPQVTDENKTETDSYYAEKVDSILLE